MSEHEEVSRESISSVEMTLNAKGGMQLKVKVYNEDPDAAKIKCLEIYNELCKEEEKDNN